MQQQQAPKNKVTTPRRRRHRDSGPGAASKAYASENDIASEMVFPLEFGNGGPSTPLKLSSASPAPSTQPPAGSKAKPRKGDQNRQARVLTSPKQTRQGHGTPPVAASSKPSAVAFAGATFHASPAPSSLPIPSFLSKAMDSPHFKDVERASQEPSPPPTDSEAPTPLNTTSKSQPAPQESPLDIFFRADRANKERARRSSSVNNFSITPDRLSPSLQKRSPPEIDAIASSQARTSRRGPALRGSTPGISAAELDGTPGRPIGRAFSTPYQERMKAAQSVEKRGSSPWPASEQLPKVPETGCADRSEALKKFLSLDSPSTSANPEVSNGATGFSAFTSGSPFGRPAAPPYPNKQANVAEPSLLQMENSLRRILKLDAAPTFAQATTVTNTQH
ncbi:hypothetical protein VTK73DRAFT_9774 [Phialemonium thermophilum]|uniref:Proteophosphoglycan 5 n=1 Tax=Phialemonium thermophilum TaxID=223376 RepID=A0ABR3XJ18_9PEZI